VIDKIGSYQDYPKPYPGTIKHMDDKVRTFILKCSLDSTHNTTLIFLYIEPNIMKIGQYPSIADLHSMNNKYSKVLPKNFSQELSKAVGLNSHGIGIGAFVYLRRIFEYLIDKAKTEAKIKPEFDDEAFRNARMDDKVTILKDYLPPFLVNNKMIYSILSKGIHELDEDECKEYFETIRKSIEYILKQELDRQDEKKHEEEISKEIQKIHQKTNLPK
jgi:hypothetical protein